MTVHRGHNRRTLYIVVSIGLSIFMCTVIVLRRTTTNPPKVIPAIQHSYPDSSASQDQADDPKGISTHSGPGSWSTPHPLTNDFPAPSVNQNKSEDTQGTSDTPETLHDWSFEQKDATNYGLNEWQCDSAFPGLYKEIERAVDYRRKVGHVTLGDVDISWKKDGLVRAMIYDRQVSVPTLF
jgi:hypothetical protein